jgi:HSP20 family protein
MARRTPQPGMQRAIRRRALSPMSAFSSITPFSMVRRVFDDMERMIATMMTDFDDVGPEMQMIEEFIPHIDVTRRNGRLVVRADLPGLSPDQINVHVNDDGLVIEGERHVEDERREGDVWQSERSYGRFYRVIPLPEGADVEHIEARFENGVLEVAVNAPQVRGRGRQIPIQSSGSQQGQGQGQQPRSPKSGEQSSPEPRR